MKIEGIVRHAQTVEFIVMALGYLPNNSLLALGWIKRGYNEHYIVWDVRNKKELFRFRCFKESENNIAFSPQCNCIAAAYPWGIEIFEITTGEKIKKINKGRHYQGISNPVACSQNGRIVARSNPHAHVVEIWDVKKERLMFKIENLDNLENRLCVSPDSRKLAVIQSRPQTIKRNGSCKHINLYDINTGKLLETFKIKIDHLISGDIDSAVFSPNGNFFAACTIDNNIILCNIKTGRIHLIFKGHTDRIGSIAFSPDGSVLASASYDSDIRIWDVETGKNIMTYIGIAGIGSKLLFSPKAEFLIFSKRSTINTIPMFLEGFVENIE